MNLQYYIAQICPYTIIQAAATLHSKTSHVHMISNQKTSEESVTRNLKYPNFFVDVLFANSEHYNTLYTTINFHQHDRKFLNIATIYFKQKPAVTCVISGNHGNSTQYVIISPDGSFSFVFP